MPTTENEMHKSSMEMIHRVGPESWLHHSSHTAWVLTSLVCQHEKWKQSHVSPSDHSFVMYVRVYACYMIIFVLSLQQPA